MSSVRVYKKAMQAGSTAWNRGNWRRNTLTRRFERLARIFTTHPRWKFGFLAMGLEPFASSEAALRR